MAVDWKKYLDAVDAAGNNALKSIEAITHVGDPDAAKAADLINKYKDYLHTVGDAKPPSAGVLTFSDWAKDPANGLPAASAASNNAVKEANDYLQRDATIGSAWDSISNGAKIVFEEVKEAGQGFLGDLGNHIPALLVGGAALAIPMVTGGGFSLVGGLLAVAAAIGVDAFSSKKGDSFINQIMNLFKPKTPGQSGDVAQKAGVTPAPVIPPYQKPLSLSSVEIKSVDGADGSRPKDAKFYMDVVTDAKSNSGVRIYGGIDEANNFNAIAQRTLDASDPNHTKTGGVLSPAANIPTSPMTDFSVHTDRQDKNDDNIHAQFGADKSAELLVKIKVARNAGGPSLAKAQAEADFMSGNFKVTTAQGKTPKDWVITAASQSNPSITRTFGGSMDDSGNLRINDVMEINPDGTSTPQPLAIESDLIARIGTITNVGTDAKPAADAKTPAVAAQPAVLDVSKLTPDKLAPLLNKFGPDTDKQDITKVTVPSNLPKLSLNLNGPKPQAAAPAM